MLALNKRKDPSPWEQVREGYTSQGFWWITGFEGTNIPQMDADEYEWTQHYQNWASDMKLVQQNLWVRHLRYTFPWYKLNPEPGKFDWDWSDRVMEQAESLGLELIANPIQFGTPVWLENGFGNPDFPQYATEYFSKLAHRYRKQLKFYTPHNEPFIASLFSGDLGHWPPYWTGLENYVKLVENIGRQIVSCVEAVKAEVPDAVMIHVDAGEYYATRETEPWLLEDVRMRNERRFIFYDLISGGITPEHPLANWLKEHGMRESSLNWFQDNAIELDVVGVDFYPHCEAWLQIINGEVVQFRDFAKDIVKAFDETGDSAKVKDIVGLPLGLGSLLTQYYERYGRPVMLTETDLSGDSKQQCTYLEYSVQEIKRLRDKGIPIIGYTWWPAIDHLNWDLALHERDNIHPVGLWRLIAGQDGKLERVETPGVKTFRRLIANREKSIGMVKDFQRQLYEVK